jgi:CDP-diacylglycerol---serine O-phosphatidyltransferase
MDLEQPPRRSKFRPVPIRYLLPNIVTLLALCLGITAIRLGTEGRYELAVSFVILAILLDAIDGRLARYLEGTSRFGAELDSLADSVNFGVAPALLLHMWLLKDVKTAGWTVALMLAICCALRLARFNVMLDDPNKPEWMGKFFTGVPAPAGAGLAMVPLYLEFLGLWPDGRKYALFAVGYVALIAAMMVSKVPTFSGKSIKRIPRDVVLPGLAAAILYLICLISAPWETLLFTAVVYLVMIPVAVRSYFAHKRGQLQSSSP